MKTLITAGTVPIERIRHAADAPAPVKFAAGELRRYLDAILGISLPIEDGAPSTARFSSRLSETTRRRRRFSGNHRTI